VEPVNTSQRHCEKSLDGHLAPQTKFVTKPDVHVRQVQHRLNQLARNRHSSLGNRPLKEDGELGPDTRKGAGRLPAAPALVAR
jgi:hypothetical protein